MPNLKHLLDELEELDVDLRWNKSEERMPYRASVV
jgi:hypothetical protein